MIFLKEQKKENDIISLEYCDFTGCDLSYLNSNQFENVSIKGSCFFETHVEFYLNDLFQKEW